MSNKFYELDKDGTKVYFNDEPLELISVVSRLNQLTYTKMKLKKELLVKRELCNAYEKKYHETNKENRLYRARIIELKNKLKDYDIKDKEFDINYWKGIEKSYVDLLDKYHSRIVDLEKEKFLLELRVEELEEDIL